jgi:hypothetical protein
MPPSILVRTHNIIREFDVTVKVLNSKMIVNAGVKPNNNEEPEAQKE